MLDNYGIRTDLALEATERFTEENVEVRGVEVHEDYNEEKDIRTTVVKITTENGARTMGRPQGSYITCLLYTSLSGCGTGRRNCGGNRKQMEYPDRRGQYE